MKHKIYLCLISYYSLQLPILIDNSVDFDHQPNPKRCACLLFIGKTYYPVLEMTNITRKQIIHIMLIVSFNGT